MEYIYERKRATVAELSEVFQVSEATVRRDDAPDPGLAFDPGIGW